MTVELSPEEIQFISEALAETHQRLVTMFVDGDRKAVDRVQSKKNAYKALRMKIDSLVLKNAMEDK